MPGPTCRQSRDPLTDGKAGTVESVWLDEMHGPRVSIRGHDGKWPVSTIKLAHTG
jgi:hypothetical protein